MSYFNAPIKVPKGAGMDLENTNGDVMSIKSSQSAFSGGNFTLYFPNTYGNADEYLKTDGAGNLTWATVSGGGSSTVSASNITVGTANVYISTTTGNVRINAPSGENVQLQVANANVAVYTGSAVTLVQPTSVTDTTESTNTVTGALIVSGGLGVSKNVNVGGNLAVTNNVTMTSNLTVSGTTEATNSTSGTLIVSGGAGIAKNAYVGGNLSVTDNVSMFSNLTISGATESTSFGSGALIVSGGVGVAKNVNVGGNLSVTNNATMTSNLTVSGTTQATNSTSGALIVSGGVGIAKNAYVSGNLSVTDNVSMFSNLTISGATESTSFGSGALIVSGGVGVSKNVNVGGNVVITGNLTVNGTTTTINSNITTIDDPVIELGTAGVADDFDRGIIGVYDSRKIFFGWDNSANVFTFIPDATVADGSNVVSGSAGRAIFGEVTAETSVSVSGTTQSTSTTTGAITVSGGVGVAKNVFVGSNLNVAGSVIYSVDSFASPSVDDTNATTLWSGSALASIKHILPPTNVAHYYHSNTSITYTTGQHMDIFFTRPSANTSATANIDFGASNLYSGSGTAQYLVFTQPGQSASLIYLGGDDSVKGWRVINTGAQVY